MKLDNLVAIQKILIEVTSNISEACRLVTEDEVLSSSEKRALLIGFLEIGDRIKMAGNVVFNSGMINAFRRDES